MSNFVDCDLTAAGRLLLGKAAGGAKIVYTKIVMGDGELPDGQTIANLEGVIHPKTVLDIVKCKVQTDGTVVIGGIYTNATEKTGFYYREIGLYAEDPDLGEILYCYGNARQFAEWIPAIGGQNVIEKTIDITTIIGPATNVTAYISADCYATVGQYEAYKDIALKAQATATQAITIAERAMTVSETAYEELQEHIREYASLQAKLNTCYDALFSEVTKNPWMVTFGDLDGVTVTSGSWNQLKARLEC